MVARGRPRFYKKAGAYNGKAIRYLGYEPDKLGMAKCAVGPELKGALTTIVGEAIFYAELIAPNDTSEYQSSFFTEVIKVPDIPYRVQGEPMARWSGRIGNKARHAILVEVGDGRGNLDYRVMRKTLEWIEVVSDG